MTFAMLGLVIGIIGFSFATVYMVRMKNMKKMHKEKGIVQYGNLRSMASFGFIDSWSIDICQ
jgi:uncharacterized membrane protein